MTAWLRSWSRGPETEDDPLEVIAASGREVGPGELVGLEHEFSVLGPDGGPVDFRPMIHRLRWDGARLDPGDANAYRLHSGLAVTADGAEAESATPPIAVRPGFTGAVRAWALAGREALGASLPAGHTLAGYSTHISVAASRGREDEIALLFARSFGVAFALLADSPGAHGIYVRPRPGRVELCSDFVDGQRLEAVAAFAVGTVRATTSAVAQGSTAALPATQAVRLLAGKERFGYRLHRTAAFGHDLYVAGRRGELPLESGGFLPVGELLRQSLFVARRHLGDAADRRDLAYLAAMVRGDAALGIEPVRPLAPGASSGARRRAKAPADAPEGRILAERRRPGFTLSPELATWDFTVFRVTGPRRTVFLSVPRQALGAVLAALDGGRLDAFLQQGLESVPRARTLRSFEAAVAAPALFGAIVEPATLLPAERSPTDFVPAAPHARRGKQLLGGRSARLAKAIPLPPARGGDIGTARHAPMPLPLAPPSRSGPAPLAPPPAGSASGDPSAGKPGRPTRGLIVLTGIVLGVAGLAAALAQAAVGGGQDSASPPSPTAPAAVPPRDTPAPSATATRPAAAGAASPEASPSPAGTATPPATLPSPTRTAVPTETAPVGAATATSPATRTATPSPVGTATPTPTAASTRTATPRPTGTPPPTRPPTLAPAPTRTATPTLTPLPPLPTATVGCVPGAACP